MSTRQLQKLLELILPAATSSSLGAVSLGLHFVPAVLSFLGSPQTLSLRVCAHGLSLAQFLGQVGRDSACAWCKAPSEYSLISVTKLVVTKSIALHSQALPEALIWTYHDMQFFATQSDLAA